MAGVFKVFSLTPAGHVRKWFLPFQDTFLPVWSLWAVGVVIGAAGISARWGITELTEDEAAVQRFLGGEDAAGVAPL